MVLAAIQTINFLPRSGVLDSIFHQTWVSVSILGIPAGGYKLTLIGLIIIVLLALLVTAITERLTTRKPGSLALAVVITVLGSLLAATFVNLPWDLAIEGVRIIAALLGAVVIAVFYTLARGSGSSSKH